MSPISSAHVIISPLFLAQMQRTLQVEPLWVLLACLTVSLLGQYNGIACLVVVALVCHVAQRRRRRAFGAATKDDVGRPLSTPHAPLSAPVETPVHDRSLLSPAESGTTTWGDDPVAEAQVGMLVSRLEACGSLRISEDCDLEMLHELGRGSFGIATLCRSRGGGKLMVLKKVPLHKMSPRDVVQLVNEASLVT